MFHIRVLYKWIHSVHHKFKEPTPFGYCATHPLEGLTEVSTVLHVAELLLPIHPLMTLFFFEYITIHEIMGHDGGYLYFIT
jgi:lathosterol oxidase